jgi:hypothetical protein
LQRNRSSISTGVTIRKLAINRGLGTNLAV